MATLGLGGDLGTSSGTPVPPGILGVWAATEQRHLAFAQVDKRGNPRSAKADMFYPDNYRGPAHPFSMQQTLRLWGWAECLSLCI